MPGSGSELSKVINRNEPINTGTEARGLLLYIYEKGVQIVIKRDDEYEKFSSWKCYLLFMLVSNGFERLLYQFQQKFDFLLLKLLIVSLHLEWM